MDDHPFSRSGPLVAALVIAAALGGCAGRAPSAPAATAPVARDVEIRRDDFGIPHIYGASDADVAYGLAWAHAEDDFHTLQETLWMTRGALAAALGRDAAPVDYLVDLLRARADVEAGYESELPADVRAVLEAYADGINDYAAAHPDEVRGSFEPIDGRDVVTGFVLTSPLFYGLDRILGRLADGPPLQREAPMGSNAFAVAPARSADGATRLIANSHQPFTGPVAWYEVRLHSEEGWDVEGALFPGSPFVLLGHNRDIAWTNTVNRPDLVDVYRLEIHPDDPYRYRLDGRWRELERGTARIRVKLWGPISWTFERETLRSAHGPVLRFDHGTYAFRYAGIGDIRQVLQYFRINKARSFDEFMDAMRLQAIPSTNFVYADRSGRIAYLYNALFPQRTAGVDWSAILPGDRSELIWKEYAPLAAVPQIVDPPSGFVFNANNHPFVATGSGDNLDRADFPAEWGIETRMTNRAWRAFTLLDADGSITRDELLAYKFDLAYDARSDLMRAVARILTVDAADDPKLRTAQQALRRWNGSMQRDSPWAALPALISGAQLRASIAMEPLPDPLEQARQGVTHLQQHFGRVDVPLGELQRLVRGRVDLPLDGGPDTLRAIHGSTDDDGRVVADKGDTYVLLVEWDAHGRLRSHAIQPFGAAVSRPRSPHYADQARLFAEKRLRPVRFDEDDLERHTRKRYRPGDDPEPSR